VTIDPNGDGVLTDQVTYVALVGAGGAWSLDTATAAPTSGSLPASGLTAYAKITATGQDAAGNAGTTTALVAPTVKTLSTNDTTPTITGTWLNPASDTLTVTVNGKSYTASVSGTNWSLTIPDSDALSVASYAVTAIATRSTDGTDYSIGETTPPATTELTITNTPVKSIEIDGGDSVNTSAVWPTFSGTSQNAGGFIIVRLDPNNDGDLSDAVTYSVTVSDGAWTLDTNTAQPISGQEPAGGYLGAVGVRATDSTGAVSDTQVLTITTPTIAISSITSSATTDANAQVNNTVGSGANWLNMTEDNAVVISGTATGASAVDLVITDVNGNEMAVNGVGVTGGNWTTSALDLSNLDNGILKVTATLSGTSISATNQAVTHDELAPQIFNTTPSEIQKIRPL
jgi:large repetitive protein